MAIVRNLAKLFKYCDWPYPLRINVEYLQATTCTIVSFSWAIIILCLQYWLLSLSVCRAKNLATRKHRFEDLLDRVRRLFQVIQAPWDSGLFPWDIKFHQLCILGSSSVKESYLSNSRMTYSKENERAKRPLNNKQTPSRANETTIVSQILTSR